MAFDFGNANDQQKEAIQTTEGPLLIIAGPGTGKTYTLVQRIVYLIKEKNLKPEKCPHCGNILELRSGKFGDFWGCSSYPDCKYTMNK